MTDQNNTQAALVDILKAVRKQARHPDYDWPMDLQREVDAALAAQPTPEPFWKLMGAKDEDEWNRFKRWQENPSVQPTPEPVAQADNLLMKRAEREALSPSAMNLLVSAAAAAKLGGPGSPLPRSAEASKTPAQIVREGLSGQSPENVTVKSASGSTWEVDPKWAPALQAALDGRREPVAVQGRDDRAQFEAEIRAQFGTVDFTQVQSGPTAGQYVVDSLQCAWWAWHAARASLPAGGVVEPTDEEIADAIECEFSESHEWPAGDAEIVRAFLKHWKRITPQPSEPIAWESTTPAYVKYISQARYDKFRPEVRRWYKPYRCSACSEKKE